MSYDEAFKTLLISSNAKLNLELNHLVIKQDENIAKLFLKDINIIVFRKAYKQVLVPHFLTLL